MAVAGILLGLTLVGLSLIQTGWHYVVLFLIIGSIGLEGAGGNLYQSVPLSRWFIRKRGKAMSWSFIGATMGILIFSPTIEHMISTIGWRRTWLVLGLGFGAVIITLAFIVIRKDPQSMGMQPDGEVFVSNTTAGADDRSQKMPVEYSWSHTQAVRHISFWTLTVVMGLRMFSLATIGIFRVPFYIEQGLSPHLVAWAIAFEALISALTAPPTGWAADRFQPRIVTVVSLMIFILTFFVTMQVRSAWQLFFSAGLFGISAASFSVTQNVLWPSYFGALHIGSIRGIALPMTLVFSSVGGPLAGIIKDTTGTYISAWLIAVGSLIISVTLLVFTPKPEITPH